MHHRNQICSHHAGRSMGRFGYFLFHTPLEEKVAGRLHIKAKKCFTQQSVKKVKADGLQQNDRFPAQ